MWVRIDAERCQGHTLCNMTAPEVFGLRDQDGHAVVRAEIVPAELEEKVRIAAAGCPERAIVLEP